VHRLLWALALVPLSCAGADVLHLYNWNNYITPDTVARFRQRFAPCGLRSEAVVPVYGLAESTWRTDWGRESYQ